MKLFSSNKFTLGQRYEKKEHTPSYYTDFFTITKADTKAYSSCIRFYDFMNEHDFIRLFSSLPLCPFRKRCSHLFYILPCPITQIPWHILGPLSVSKLRLPSRRA